VYNHYLHYSVCISATRQEKQLRLQQCFYRLGMDLKLILHRTITISGKRSLVIDQSFKRLFFYVLAIHNVSLTPLYKVVKTLRIVRDKTTFWKRQNSVKFVYIKISLRISYQNSYLRISRILRVCIWFVLWAPLIVYQVFNIKHFSL